MYFHFFFTSFHFMCVCAASISGPRTRRAATDCSPGTPTGRLIYFAVWLQSESRLLETHGCVGNHSAAAPPLYRPTPLKIIVVATWGSSSHSHARAGHQPHGRRCPERRQISPGPRRRGLDRRLVDSTGRSLAIVGISGSHHHSPERPTSRLLLCRADI